ncbi:MAG: hypothetical protein ACK4UV_00020, partial [Ignavibacterium sp.]
ESQSRVIISTSESNSHKLEPELKHSGVSFTKLGVVKGNSMKIKNIFEVELSTLSDIYFDTIPKIMSGEE